MFKPNGIVMLIVDLTLQLAAAKKRIKQLESDKKCLENMLQTKIPFKARV